MGQGEQGEYTGGLGEELQLLQGFCRGLAGEGVTWLEGEEGGIDTAVQELLEGVRTAGPRSTCSCSVL